MKPETRIEGPWTDKNEEMFIPFQYKKVIDAGLREWQDYVINDNSQHERYINLIYDTTGNIGKTSVFGILGSQGLAQVIPPMTDYKDVMRMVMDLPTATKYIVDMPRALDQKRTRGLYTALETIKSGYAYDERYRTRTKWFDSPTIWVFCNQLPDLHWLTTDRWKIYTVVDEKLKEYKIQ